MVSGDTARRGRRTDGGFQRLREIAAHAERRCMANAEHRYVMRGVNYFCRAADLIVAAHV
jgi:hypothetical protein